MAEERLTEELLEHLRASARPEAYLDEGVTIDRTLSDYLNELRIEKGLKRSAIFRACGINQTQGYDIFGGKSKPGRDRAIMLALGMGCTLRETQRIMRLAGVSELWPKTRRDAIIIWCIEHGMSRQETDDELFRLDEDTLFKNTGPLT